MKSFRGFLILTFVATAGCGPSPMAVVLPTVPLTEVQKIEIQKEDAEACGCGRATNDSSLVLNP